MKAAIVTPCFLPVPAVCGGAAEVLITNLIDANEADGQFDFDVYTIPAKKLDKADYHHARVIQIDYPIAVRLWCRMKNLRYRLRGSSRRSAYLYERICGLLNKEEYDFILVENNMDLYREIYENTRHGGRLLFHMHNDVDHDAKTPAHCRLVADTAKGIFTASGYLKQRFCEFAPNNKTRVFYNCIDSGLFYPLPELREKSRERFSFAPGEVVFLYAGRLSEEKGVRELVTAFQGVLERHKQARLLIAGSSWFNRAEESDYVNQLRELSEKWGASIRFTGFIPPDEMPKVYAAADAVVVPTICEEVFGVTALEAMAMRLPVIVTKSGGLPEVVDDSCALIVERDVDLIINLERAMEQLMEQPALRDEMGLQGLKKFRETPAFHKENYFTGFCSLAWEAL